MTEPVMRDSHGMSRWSVISAVTWLLSLSFLLPVLVALVLPGWRAFTSPDRAMILVVASGLTLTTSILARQRARLLDARRRMHDALQSGQVHLKKLNGRIYFGSAEAAERFFKQLQLQDHEKTGPMTAEHWRQLKEIARSTP